MKKMILSVSMMTGLMIVSGNAAKAASAIELTFGTNGAGIDYDAMSSIKAILEEDQDSLITKTEWRMRSRETKVQLCVALARPDVMESFKARFEEVLGATDESTSLQVTSACN